jgi:hypothetical protein
LNSEQFTKSLVELAGSKGFVDFEASANVAEITNAFGEELQKARAKYKEVTEDLLVKSDDGKFKPATTPHPTCPWEIKEGMEDTFTQTMDTFLATEVTLPGKLIKPSDLGTVQLAPAQILALEPILDFSLSKQESSAH